MYKLLSLIKNDFRFIAIGLIFAFLSIGSVSHYPMVREYAMQEMFFILITYVWLKIYLQANSSDKISKKAFFIYPTSVAFFLLSGYFTAIYACFLALILIIKGIISKNKTFLTNLFIFALITIVIIFLICPNYFNFSANEHSGTFMNNFYSLNFNTIFHFLTISKPILTKFIFYPILFIIILISLSLMCFKRIRKIILKKDANNFNYELVFGLCLLVYLWITSVLFLAPWQLLRYVSAGIPIISIIYAYYAYRLIPLLSNIFIILFVVILFQCNVYRIITLDTRITNPIKIVKNAPIIITEQFFYNIPMIFDLLDFNNIVRFEDKIPNKTYKNKSFYLFCNKSYKQQEINWKSMTNILGHFFYLIEN